MTGCDATAMGQQGHKVLRWWKVWSKREPNPFQTAICSFPQCDSITSQYCNLCKVKVEAQTLHLSRGRRSLVHSRSPPLVQT